MLFSLFPIYLAYLYTQVYRHMYVYMMYACIYVYVYILFMFMYMYIYMYIIFLTAFGAARHISKHSFNSCINPTRYLFHLNKDTKAKRG